MNVMVGSLHSGLYGWWKVTHQMLEIPPCTRKLHWPKATEAKKTGVRMMRSSHLPEFCEAQLAKWYKSWFSDSHSIWSKSHGLCLNRFHYRWLHFQLCECSCTVRQRLCGKLPNADLCPDGQGVKQRSIMPSQWAMPGIPITIFYRLVYEPRTTMLYRKSYHHPEETTIFLNGGWLPGQCRQCIFQIHLD